VASVLVPNAHYSIPVERSGEVVGEESDERMFFRILGTRTWQENPKVLKTHATKSVTAKFRVQLQHMDVWGPAHGDVVCVFPECDPDWMNCLDVAPFQRLQRQLTRWTDTPSDRGSSFDLTNPVAATPKFAITDQRCPVITISGALHALGWKPFIGDFVHKSSDDKRFDGRAPQSHKLYYLALLKLDDIVANNMEDGVHSGQPQSYYKLLLMGQPTQPRLGDLEYASQLARLTGGPMPKPKKSRVAPLAIEDVDMDVVGQEPLPIADVVAAETDLALPPVPARFARLPRPLVPNAPEPLPLIDVKSTSSPYENYSRVFGKFAAIF